MSSPQTKRRQRQRCVRPMTSISQPRTASSLLSRARQCLAALLSPATWHSAVHYLLLLFLGCLVCSSQMSLETKARTDLMTTSRRKVLVDLMDTIRRLRPVPYDGLDLQYRSDGTYAGEFQRGLCAGKGVSKSNGSRFYGGDWVDDCAEGYGVEVSNFARYKGQFLRGTRSGYGSMQDANGLYMGQWQNGSRHGIGRHEDHVDGSFYEGEFREDMMHGFGAYRNSNGDIYQGTLFQNEFRGAGIYYFSSGNRCEGSWRGNKMDGYGVYIRADDGVSLSGKWVEGNIKEEDYIPTFDPRIEGAVQAAQEAAQNCRQLGDIENQVLNAVAEADKALTDAKLVSEKAHALYDFTY